jgi:hypothetical protein
MCRICTRPVFSSSQNASALIDVQLGQLVGTTHDIDAGRVKASSYSFLKPEVVSFMKEKTPPSIQ